MADKGYYNPNSIEEVESDGTVECHVAIPKDKEEEMVTRIYIKEINVMDVK